ncbi:MAG TPA: TetR/AcrR family transcriptional regulator [Streptosporangiaceae bacterium]|jgi:AcrR family transcriptional regulator
MDASARPPETVRRTDGTRVEPSDIGRREAAKRREILEVTWRLIAARGYHNTRVQDIAAACGTSTGTIHYYFPGKGAVLDAAMEYCFDQTGARQQAELSTIEDARERLVRVVEIQVQEEAESGQGAVWLQLWAQATLRPDVRDVNAEMYSRWEETVRRVLRRGWRQGVFRTDLDEEQTLGTLLALLDGLAMKATAGMMTRAAARDLAVAWLQREVFAAPPPRRARRPRS